MLAASHRVLAHKARTFSLAARLLPRTTRDDAALVYAFCRLVDDTADEARDARSAAAALERLRAELLGHAPPRPLLAAFRATAARLELPLHCARELIDGAESDLGAVRVPDDAELLRYCYRVAGTVGLMMCAVLGVRRADARPFAVDLGIAMQLTNIVRDVAEDARLGRVYLPAERLRRAGVEPAALVAGRAERRAVAAVALELLALADLYYCSADAGMRDIPGRARPAILLASRVYRAIGLRLRRRGGDVLAGRTMLSRRERLAWSARALAAAATPRMLGFGPRPLHDPALHRPLAGLLGADA